MKKVFFILFASLLALSLRAQIDRTTAPKPAPAREIKIGAYQSFEMKNGLKVFVVENHKLPRVQFSINLKNDPLLEGDKAGYVNIAGSLIGTGTKTRKKAQLDEEVDFIGASLSTSPSGIFASSLTKHSGKLLELLTDVLYNPSFLQEELDKLKTQTLSGISAGKDDPNSIASNVRGALVYGKNHPYGEIATEKTVGSVTLDDCKNYYATYFKPNNAYLIIVGDIDLKNAKVIGEKYFGAWTSGAVKNPAYARPEPPAKTTVALVDRPASVQSVISIAYPVDLKTGSADVIPARVTNQILGGSFSSRLMQNLREKHGFTYGSSSQLVSDPIVGSFSAGASVRNIVTDSSVHELISEMQRIVREPVTEKELQDAKASISGAFGRSLENPQTLASFALNTAKFSLPADYYSNYLRRMDAVSIADVQVSAKKYIKPENAYILVVGKGSEIADKLKPFGEVRYYDIEGNNYVPSSGSALPAGLTAEKVIDNFLAAIGGKEKLMQVKSLRHTFKAHAMGMDLLMVQTKKALNQQVLEVTGNGATLSKVICDGMKVSIFQQGQSMPVDDKRRETTIIESAIFKELSYAAMGIKLALKGIENVDGKDCYVIEYTLPSGDKFSEYFDKGNGLKVQLVKEAQGPQGKVQQVSKYSDFREENGIKFAHMIRQSQGAMAFTFEAVKIEVNPPVDDSFFKTE